jgi:hypothetical protein
VGEEIAFGRPGQVYFGFDTAPLPEGLYGLRLDGTPRFGIRTGGVSRLDQPQPATGPDGTVYVNIAWRLNAYSPAGQFKWSFFGDGTNVLTAPDVDRNGVTYIGQNLSYLYAVNPNGTERWHVTDSGIIEQGPVVNPANTLMVVGGQITYGQPGLIQAYSTAGVLLWTEQLPPENNEQIVPYARARYSPDGLVAYLPTATLGLSQDDYSYIYAVRVTP